MNMTNTDLLSSYSHEIGIPYFTLEQLIASHRRLREANKQYSEDSKRAWTEAKQRGRLVGLQEITGEHIRLECLRNMTMKEIIEMLSD